MNSTAASARRTWQKRDKSAIRLRIFTRDGWKCVYCGEAYRVDRIPCSIIGERLGRPARPGIYLRPNLVLDHKLPLAKGGDSRDENLQTLCWKCNGRKGAK